MPRKGQKSGSFEDKNEKNEKNKKFQEKGEDSAKKKMKEIDKASMNDEDYVLTLLEILDTSNTNKDETDSFSVYG